MFDTYRFKQEIIRTSGTTRNDSIRNGDTRDNQGIVPIEDKMRVNRLRWFGHVYRRLEQAVLYKGDDFEQPLEGEEDQRKLGQRWLRMTRYVTCQKKLP